MEDRSNRTLAKIWKAVAEYFEALKLWVQIEDKPVYPLPAYQTLRHLEHGRHVSDLADRS